MTPTTPNGGWRPRSPSRYISGKLPQSAFLAVGGRPIANNYHGNLPDNIGVLAPGGGARGITPAGQAELTRQRFANVSLPTRVLGQVLGAAETIVPAAGSPKETLRQMAKAARDYIVSGVERGFVRTGFDQGRALGEAAKAGDPHAQGAAFATVATTAAGAAALYGRAAAALPKRVAVDLAPLPKPLADPLDVPTYQRATAPIRQRFATDAEVRLHNLKQRYANHTAATILPASPIEQEFTNLSKLLGRPETVPVIQAAKNLIGMKELRLRADNWLKHIQGGSVQEGADAVYVAAKAALDDRLQEISYEFHTGKRK